MIHRRSISILGVVVLSTGLLAACSDDAEEQGGGAAPSADSPVDLRMTVWTSDESQLKLFDEIADDYIEENPALVSSVSFEVVPFEDYSTTLTTQLAGGSTPDLAWIFESNAPEFVESGALADIKPVLQGTDGYDYDDILPSSLDLWSQDEGLYAYPFSNSPFTVFVNTDRIAEADQPSPAELLESGEWTFDAARNIATESVDELGGAGLIPRDFNYKTWGNLSPIWAGWDAAPWSADGSTCTFTSPEMVDSMTWIHEAVFEDGAIPGPGTSADFFAGDVTMTITQVSRAAALDDSFEWDVLPLPSGPAGQQNVIGQAGIGVLQNGDNPEIAADFLAHFTSPKNAEKLATYFPPPRESLLTVDVLSAANPLLSNDQLEKVVIGGIDGGITKPSHANFAKLDSVVRSELDALWTADADVEAVLKDVCAAAQPLLQD